MNVMLVLQVWCVDEWSGTQQLIGTSRVPLEPLRLGFAEVAGYYDIHAAALGEPASTGQVQGQIHVSLTPRWAPGPLERGPAPANFGQMGAPSPFGQGGPTSFGPSGIGASSYGGPSPLGPGGLGMLLQPASRPAGGIPYTTPAGPSEGLRVLLLGLVFVLDVSRQTQSCMTKDDPTSWPKSMGHI